MKNILTILLFFLISIHQVNSQELRQITDWNEAKKIAKQENKNILIVLTASEWCKPCIKMKKKVFSEFEFINYINNNLVLFLIELPGGTIKFNSPEYQSYDKFRTKYNSNALPSLILTNFEGKKIKILNGRMTSLKNVMNELNFKSK